MKVLFVGDNSAVANWGRAASIALRQLIQANFEISGTVVGENFVLASSEIGYVGTLTPQRYQHLFRYALARRDRRPYSWYVKLEERLGARDFISENPGESLKSILANRQRHAGLSRICTQAAASDVIVIDGDGDIVFSTPPRRQTLFVLAMIELGLHLRKPVCLVNSMLSDCPTSGRNEQTLNFARDLFRQCRLVVLRDLESVAYARAHMPETEAQYIPDSLFTWAGAIESGKNAKPAIPSGVAFAGSVLDTSRPYICIGGGALSASQPERAAVSYTRLVDRVARLGFGICLTENDTPDGFLRDVARERNLPFVAADGPIEFCASLLAHARLFISGRYHPSIMASLGGTPCIFLGSHAHKMGSLSDVLGYETRREFSAFPDEQEIDQIVSLAGHYLDQGDMLRTRIREAAAQHCTLASTLPRLIEDSSRVH